eukprot:SM000437S15689  [mRNA]  locus=s437:21824:23240:+ [translate_table: standard]
MNIPTMEQAKSAWAAFLQAERVKVLGDEPAMEAIAKLGKKRCTFKTKSFALASVAAISGLHAIAAPQAHGDADWFGGLVEPAAAVLGIALPDEEGRQSLKKYLHEQISNVQYKIPLFIFKLVVGEITFKKHRPSKKQRLSVNLNVPLSPEQAGHAAINHAAEEFAEDNVPLANRDHSGVWRQPQPTSHGQDDPGSSSIHASGQELDDEIELDSDGSYEDESVEVPQCSCCMGLPAQGLGFRQCGTCGCVRQAAVAVKCRSCGHTMTRRSRDWVPPPVDPSEIFPLLDSATYVQRKDLICQSAWKLVRQSRGNVQCAIFMLSRSTGKRTGRKKEAYFSYGAGSAAFRFSKSEQARTIFVSLFNTADKEEPAETSMKLAA